MNKLKTIALLMLLAISNTVFCQNDVEMADSLYQSGKIYVVVGVIAIIFVGIIIYLISIDRKVSKLEKDIESNK